MATHIISPAAGALLDAVVLVKDRYHKRRLPIPHTVEAMFAVVAAALATGHDETIWCVHTLFGKTVDRALDQEKLQPKKIYDSYIFLYGGL